MNIIKKGEVKKLCYGLSHKEFKCQCDYKGCRATLIDPKLLEAYELFRRSVAVKLTITSGYRCPQHNEEERGTGRSRHTTGQAVDILYSSMKSQYAVEKVEEIAKISGFTFVKWYPNLEFFHCDVR